jgi:lon-related putative ATP-dependent protease
MTEQPVPLAADRLRRRCDPTQLDLNAASAPTRGDELIGQPRAVNALAFGLAMPGNRFNVFVAGPPGTGKTTAIHGFLDRAARGKPVPSDWCYVHNFRQPDRPRALRLAPGGGQRLRESLRGLVQAARREIPRAFESEEYIARREAIVAEVARKRNEGLAAIAARAQASGFSVQTTPMGIALIPVMGNRPLTDEDIANLRPEMREQIQQRRAAIEAEVGAFLKAMRAAEREARAHMEAQDRDVALNVIGGIVDDLTDDYQNEPAVCEFLTEIREGILTDILLFRGHPLPADGASADPVPASDSEHVLHERAFRKYDVNVIIDNGGATGAPVVTEINPTYPNLVGRIEREAILGALVTDFTLIAPGALHRANGGYLVLRIDDLMRASLAWDTLKRTLREGKLVIEDASEVLGLTTTRTLRPDPIPLDIKVLLVGEPLHFHLLSTIDPDFRGLFKVRADFDTQQERTPAAEAEYAAFLSACVIRDGGALDADALARLIEESSRLASDQRKLTMRLGEMLDVVQEAAHWAQADGAATIGAAHVRRAVEQRIYRSAMVAERLRELTARGVLIIRPQGTAVGQVHGLSVVSVGDLEFGRPVRITASAGVGRDGVLDIEREAELGGRIHRKGVLILGGYLTDRYAHDTPLALSARLVFEQSYEEVEGDSASLAELLALLSRLADVPLRQGIAVTGSVNQRGEVQAVGGVNQKIEGFYETCVAMGLTGDQGVLLPAANVDNLMLREDVVAAAAAGRFHVYPVESVDQALMALTGMAADDIHARVAARLRDLATTLRAYAVSLDGARADTDRPAAKVDTARG